MNSEFTFSLKSIRFDEDYHPATNTRATTNFANLARGAHRQENLRNALTMINNRFNALADWDNPDSDRYGLALDIISVEIAGGADAFPLIEILKTTIIDHHRNTRIDGIAGNNFSSYVRDYDFSVLLPTLKKRAPDAALPDTFGDLHGKLFQCFVNAPIYRDTFAKAPVICLSASSSRTYQRTDNWHPILGVEYRQDAPSLTDQYFAKMGLRVRFFMPKGSVAPLAFYCAGDVLGDYSNLELIGTISTMETFQKIYRPEIYNANAAAGKVYQPSLTHRDYATTQITYDRDERSRLGVAQGKFAEEHFIKPNQFTLAQWSAAQSF
ncbi:DUF1852 domain-containing protein [Ketogulonicigenium vulgare]|uniref:DUF1852 domain-containing protein n=1 Tax=Ketogulonicigenium vulgare TaxID=92945 RepID=UPI00235918CC|nr:DUF1852 domain-containing protein [Ketogulonicigenium vulgare]